MAKKPTKTIIHVNRQFIAFNAKYGKPVLPTYIIRKGSKPSVYAYSFKPVQLCGNDPRKQKQLSCGARVWLETIDEVEPIDPMTFKEADALRKKYAAKI